MKRGKKDQPKSRNPIRPSRSTHRFPACTSAWKVSQEIKLPNLHKKGLISALDDGNS